MEMYIGKQETDGTVRYVSILWHYGYGTVPRMLKNFYQVESRVDALIALGNLTIVNGTPYGKYTWDQDCVHCRAAIRDEGEKKGKHQPRYSSMSEFMKLNGHLYLYKEGKWHYREGEEFISPILEYVPSPKANTLKDIEVMQINDKGELCTLSTREMTCWQDLNGKANAEALPYFVFREGKLVQTINHPLNR